MSKVQVATVGAVLDPGAGDLTASAVELEKLGVKTVWLSGGPLENLGQVAAVVRATEQVRVATGILAVDRFASDEVAALYSDLEATHPGRFVVGLGGAHGAKPLQTLNAYLDRLDAVPLADRVLAALGPRMLDLASERAGGALPVLVTPEYTAQARVRLGADTALVVEQLVVVDAGAERARAAARVPLSFLSQSPAYRANFRRMGFTDDEIFQLADRLVDALVPWGDATAVAAHITGHLQAGADHVAVLVVAGAPDTPLMDSWRELTGMLLAR